jgi:hypothetical protein
MDWRPSIFTKGLFNKLLYCIKKNYPMTKSKKLEASRQRKLELLFGKSKKTKEQIEAIEKFKKIDELKKRQITSRASVWTVK